MEQATPLYQRIYGVIRRIPKGRVSTYGSVAKLIGCGARQVGYAMAALPDATGVPWHRVVNFRGGHQHPRRDWDHPATQARGRRGGVLPARHGGPGPSWLATGAGQVATGCSSAFTAEITTLRSLKTLQPARPKSDRLKLRQRYGL